MDRPKERVQARAAPPRPVSSAADATTPFPVSNLTVRAKISSSSINKNASNSRSNLRPASGARSPIRAHVTRVVGGPDLNNAFTSTRAASTTGSSPAHDFVPKAKKSPMTVVNSDNASASASLPNLAIRRATSAAPLDPSGNRALRSAPNLVVKPLLNPSRDVISRSPTPTSRVRVAGGPSHRMRSGSITAIDDGRGTNFAPSNLSSDAGITRPDYATMRRASNTSSVSTFAPSSTRSDAAPTKVRAKLSIIALNSEPLLGASGKPGVVPPSTPQFSPLTSPIRPLTSPPSSYPKHHRSSSVTSGSSHSRTSPSRTFEQSSSAVGQTSPSHRRSVSGVPVSTVRSYVEKHEQSPVIFTASSSYPYPTVTPSSPSPSPSPVPFRVRTGLTGLARAQSPLPRTRSPTSMVSTLSSSTSMSSDMASSSFSGAAGNRRQASTSSSSRRGSASGIRHASDLGPGTIRTRKLNLPIGLPLHSRSGSSEAGFAIEESSGSSGDSVQTTSLVNGHSSVDARRGTPNRLLAEFLNGDTDLDGDEVYKHEQASDGEEDEARLGGGLDRTHETGEPRDAAREAKSNRKIADLEITNKSLLTINTMLEADKLRLSREIRDVRRRLRERLSLPPEAYTALVRHEQRTAASRDPDPAKSKPTSPGTASTEPNVFSREDDLDDDEDIEEGGDAQPDPAYDRVASLVGALLLHGQAALNYTPAAPSSAVKEKDLDSGGGGGPKVLSPAEVEQHYELLRRRENGGHDLPSDHPQEDVFASLRHGEVDQAALGIPLPEDESGVSD